MVVYQKLLRVIILYYMTSKINEIVGCGVSYGNPCPRCGGGWPGTTSTTKQLTEAAFKGRLNPDKLGCKTLIERAQNYLEAIDFLTSNPQT